jgi:flagellar hook-basal body complex protein FliE
VIPPLAPVVPSPATPSPAASPSQQGNGSFGSLLSGELGKLEDLQQKATTASQELATGKANDVSTVAMEVERASLALQLAVQVRNKAVDAYQDLFRMQV